MSIHNGMILIKPSSVDYTGTSATINDSGSVEFSAVTSLSLNGVFSSDYDNYVISMRHVHNFYRVLLLRFRSGGTDDSTSSSYVDQNLEANGSAVYAQRGTGSDGRWGATSSAQRSGVQLHIYGPHLAEPTAWRSVTSVGQNNALIYDWAGTHNQLKSYDGLTFFTTAPSATGMISVYGLRQ